MTGMDDPERIADRERISRRMGLDAIGRGLRARMEPSASEGVPDEIAALLLALRKKEEAEGRGAGGRQGDAAGEGSEPIDQEGSVPRKPGR